MSTSSPEYLIRSYCFLSPPTFVLGSAKHRRGSAVLKEVMVLPGDCKGAEGDCTEAAGEREGEGEGKGKGKGEGEGEGEGEEEEEGGGGRGR
eukprot:1408475-Rhodomonas_salina.1